jgi:hypothetical protein
MDGVIWIFFVLLIGFGCPVCLTPTYSHAGEASRRACCANNMKQIGLALHNYHDVRKHFPPLFLSDKDGKPLYNWMVQILPNMEYDNIYQQLHKDKPWDSEHNAKVLNIAISELICPSDFQKKTNSPPTMLRSSGRARFGEKKGR